MPYTYPSSSSSIVATQHARPSRQVSSAAAGARMQCGYTAQSAVRVVAADDFALASIVEFLGA